MNIIYCYIDGFRSVRNLYCDVKGNQQVFIGKNDVGKSNILRALDLYFNNSIDKIPLRWDDDFNINYNRARGKNAPNYITIKVGFNLSSDPKKPKIYKELIEKLGKTFFITKKYSKTRFEIYYSNETFAQ